MAAASLGRLTLDLLVRLGSFEQGMNQADRRTRQTTENMGRAFSGFRDQVADALGGTQIGSIVDSFNAKIGSLRGGVLVAGAALTGMAVFLNGVCRHEQQCRNRESTILFLNGVCRHER